MSADALANRLAKNVKSRRAWAAREGVTAFRLYDLDMPEWPVAIDSYANVIHVIAYPNRKQLKAGVDALTAQVREACVTGLGVTADDVIVKVHEPKAWGETPFEKSRGSTRLVTVEEYGRKFECNLTDFLDTGLFLDHRPTRKRVLGAAPRALRRRAGALLDAEFIAVINGAEAEKQAAWDRRVKPQLEGLVRDGLSGAGSEWSGRMIRGLYPQGWGVTKGP